MSNIIKLIKREDFIETSWSGGKTTQIYIYPEDANYKSLNFKFRISSATVELEKSEFTKLEGVYRFITPINTNLKLTHNHKDYIELQPFQTYDFDGKLNTTSYGKARDFNLMLANGAKGSLASIYVNKKYTLNEELDSNQYTVITCNHVMNLEIDNMTYILNPIESLVINSTSKTSLSIRITAITPGNILISKISI